VREFAFEVALCAELECEDRLVSRQLGAGVHGRRVLDVVAVSPGPGFAERAAITAETIPPAAIEADVGPGRSRFWREAFEGDGEHVEAAMERAVEVGFLERERHNGRTDVRQTTRYPEWFDDVLAIENKPDLGRPGALERQLRTDVSLALVDRVVLATASHVTGAHHNRIPDAVGIWQFDPDTGERTVLREPERLPVAEPGVELVDERPGRADVRVVEPAEKARARRRLAERAYGKGWRTYEYPACEQCTPDADGLPYCAWKGRPIRASEECGVDCDGHAAGSPTIATDALRAARSAWEPEPEGRAREQVGLDQF
jgi:hypothetical protein